MERGQVREMVDRAIPRERKPEMRKMTMVWSTRKDSSIADHRTTAGQCGEGDAAKRSLLWTSLVCGCFQGNMCVWAFA